MKPDWSDPEILIMAIVASSALTILLVFTYRLVLL
jgi:hypothetical protein